MNIVLWFTVAVTSQVLWLIGVTLAGRVTSDIGQLFFVAFVTFVISLGIAPTIGALIGAVYWIVLQKWVYNAQSWKFTRAASCLGWAISVLMAYPIRTSFDSPSFAPNLGVVLFLVEWVEPSPNNAAGSSTIGWGLVAFWMVLGIIVGIITGSTQGLLFARRFRRHWLTANIAGWVAGLVGAQAVHLTIFLILESLHISAYDIGWVISALLTGLTWGAFGGLFGLITGKALELL
jgi:hypothetical protein